MIGWLMWGVWEVAVDKKTCFVVMILVFGMVLIVPQLLLGGKDGEQDVFCNRTYNLAAESKSIGCVCRTGDSFTVTLPNTDNSGWTVVSDPDIETLCSRVNISSLDTGMERTKFECTCPDDNETLNITVHQVYKKSGIVKPNGQKLSLSTAVLNEEG
jgi:hypothetical protein